MTRTYGWGWSSRRGWYRVADSPQLPPGPFSVFLDDPGPRRMAAIAAFADHTGLGLKGSTDLFDSAPTVVVAQVCEEAARLVCAALTEAGAIATIIIQSE